MTTIRAQDERQMVKVVAEGGFGAGRRMCPALPMQFMVARDSCIQSGGR